MKSNKIILTLSMLLIAVCSFGRKPPVSVQKAFEQKFPGSVNVSWTKENAEMWEAFFTINGIKNSANFTIEGNWVETEVTIKISELPSEVKTALDSTNSDWNITDINRIQTANNGVVYTVDISKGIVKKVVAFKEDGLPVI